MTPQTLPELEQVYRSARRKMVERKAKEGKTQTQAAHELGVKLTCLNNLIRREGIDWPVKRQGLPKQIKGEK